MRTYDSDGWVYTGHIRNLMRYGDRITPETDPWYFTNIKTPLKQVRNEASLSCE